MLAWNPAIRARQLGRPRHIWDQKVTAFCRYKQLGHWMEYAQDKKTWLALSGSFYFLRPGSLCLSDPAMPVWLVNLNFSKVFDCVHWPTLWNALRVRACPITWYGCCRNRMTVNQDKCVASGDLPAIFPEYLAWDKGVSQFLVCFPHSCIGLWKIGGATLPWNDLT